MPKPKKCDCKVEFSTDVFKKRYAPHPAYSAG